MINQKFKAGDLVQIAKDLGSSVAHFQNDKKAIILYSYADKFGGDNTTSYALYIERSGFSAWYYEPQLTLIESNRNDLKEQWEKESKEKRLRQSDLDWIFEQGPALLTSCSSASIEALAKCLGITNLWGTRGEGFTYMMTARYVLFLAAPFLNKHMKTEWLHFCEKARA